MISIWKWFRGQFDSCPHDNLGTTMFRDENGKEYFPCIDCGARIRSAIQFGKYKIPPYGDWDRPAPQDMAVDELIPKLVRKR